MALFSSADMVSLLLLLVTRPLKFSVPNAAPQPLPEAGAERTLEAVGCPGRVGGSPTTPPTEPYVKISLIRFLGTARFHTATLPDSQTTRVIRLRPHSSTSSPGCPLFLGSPLSLDPACHDPGPGQRIRRHHPTTRSPRPR